MNIIIILILFIKLENKEFLKKTPDGGGSFTGYSNNDTICKIYEWIGLSYGVLKTEYYYWNEKLFFAYQTEDVFNYTLHVADTVEFKMNTDEAYKLVNTSEKRFYFN